MNQRRVRDDDIHPRETAAEPAKQIGEQSDPEIAVSRAYPENNMLLASANRSTLLRQWLK
ncbi:hypothetical protein GCM10022384_20620 [Streptomyces marokkonensis]|uniref:Uncharacterized protein n=1 Tax=Streptomyces marokkonensis TaxID=324855 RepID=A0ABP7PQB2_9ACTN